jgi:hypothetical protein
VRVAPLLIAVTACGSSHALAPAPSVDLARLRSEIQGDWTTYHHNDASTVATTLGLHGTTATVTVVWQYVSGDSLPPERSPIRYQLSPTGTLEIAPAPRGRENQRFTAIVADRETCTALVGHPCRALTGHGFLAQSADYRTYRRESASTYRDSLGEHSQTFVAVLRFERPARELTTDCRASLEVTASSVVKGERHRPVTRTFQLACEVAPRSKGKLSRLTMRGFGDPSEPRIAWSTYVARQHVLDGQPDETIEAFGRAFHPVMYFDPADPRVLFLEGLAEQIAYWDASANGP